MSELAELLVRVERFVRRFVVLGEAQATAIVLWVAHSWAVEAAYATPYLHVRSAEPESGKTRLLEVTGELVREPLSTMNISDAALFRAIEQKSPTLLIDEVDAIFGPKAREHEDKRSLLNAGYRRGLLAYRMGGANSRVLESFAVFCPKMLVGIGGLPATLASRCLRVELKRRRLSEPVEDFYPEDVSDEADELKLWLGSWSSVAVETLRAARPDRIDGLRDRTNEVWRPLLAIAELADDGWGVRARRAAIELVDDNEDGEASLGLLLLSDVRAVFDERDVERLTTADLLAALALFDESPWGEWWLDPTTGTPRRGASRRLAKLLAPYGIRSTTVRGSDRVAKGYKREDFADAWERFLPARVGGLQALHPLHPAPHEASDVTDVTDVTHVREQDEGAEIDLDLGTASFDELIEHFGSDSS
jgi:Protein of unknown function (DUF3631)